MSNEELDEARAKRAKKAWRLWIFMQEADPRPPVIAEAEPVDPDVLAVRVVLADRTTDRISQQSYLNGRHDAQIHFQSALAAYRAGRAAR